MNAHTSFIQKATKPGGATPSNPQDQRGHQSSNTNPSALDPGAAAHEMNLLANEVYSLLKRRLLFEAERSGKRF